MLLYLSYFSLKQTFNPPYYQSIYFTKKPYYDLMYGLIPLSYKQFYLKDTITTKYLCEIANIYFDSLSFNGL